MTKPERVICAAVWVDDDMAHPHQSMPTGLVFGGWRHHNCIQSALAYVHARGKIPEREASRHQGFLTSLGRFVDRQEAGVVAYAAGQTQTQKATLMSEDLY